MVEHRPIDETGAGVASTTGISRIALGTIGAIILAAAIIFPLARYTPAGPRAGSIRGRTRRGSVACLSSATLDSALQTAKFVASPANGCVTLPDMIQVTIEDSQPGRRLIRLPNWSEPLWAADSAVRN